MPEKPDKIELEQLLSMYIDGDCSDAQRERIEAALVADPALRDLCDQLIRTVESIRDVGAEAAPTHVRQRILSQLERRALLDDGRRTGGGRAALRRVVPWATAAMLLAMAGGGWWFYSHREAARPVMLADNGSALPQRSISESAPRDTAPAPQPLRSAGPSAAEPPAGLAQGMPRGAGGALPSPRSQVAQPAENLAVQDDTYREAAAKALIARQVAAQEMATAQAAAEKAAAKDAARQLAGLRQALTPQPQEVTSADSSAAQDVQPLEPRRSFTDPSGHVGALEISARITSAQRHAVVADAERAVKRLGGRLTLVASALDSTTIVAAVPLQMQFLLADTLSGFDGVHDVQLHELAADTMSLEIDSILTQQTIVSYPDASPAWPREVLDAPWKTAHAAGGPMVPVRIVIHMAADEAPSTVTSHE